MKYNIVISRTYATEIVVDAENIGDAYQWIENNEDSINHEELEQCNIINTDTSAEPLTPSPQRTDNPERQLQGCSCLCKRVERTDRSQRI